MNARRAETRERLGAKHDSPSPRNAAGAQLTDIERQANTNWLQR